VLAALERMYAKLRLRANRAKSKVEPAHKCSVLSYSFWYAKGGTVMRRVALTALRALKQRAARDNQTQRRAEHEKRGCGAAEVSAGLEGILPTGGHPEGISSITTNGSATAYGRCSSSSGNAAPRSMPSCANSTWQRTPRSVSPRTPAGGGATRPCWYMSVSIPATTIESEYPDLLANLNLPNRRMRTRMSGGVAGE
jgi:hypothetical protein